MNGNKGKDEADFCRILLKTNALRFGVFKLTSGKLSPYYIDLRALPSYPESFKKVMEIYEALLRKTVGLEKFDRISCVPTSGLLFASVLAYKVSKPILYTRKEKRTHGRERKIEGVLKPGDKIIILDDLITTGKSLIEAIEAIRTEGGIVEDAIVLIDRQEGGKDNLNKAEVNLHSFMNIAKIANILFESNVIDEEKYNEIIKQSIDRE
ncbi:orotate phosphoribosyltransferase [[Eubacterium] cellulosolvens]